MNYIFFAEEFHATWPDVGLAAVVGLGIVGFVFILAKYS